MAPASARLRKRSGPGTRTLAATGRGFAEPHPGRIGLGGAVRRLGDEDAYPAFEMKAAVLLERLSRNHPLPDGNKRAAFVVTVLFCELNGRRWREPDAEVDATMVERVAAGEVELAELASSIDVRTDREK